MAGDRTDQNGLEFGGEGAVQMMGAEFVEPWERTAAGEAGPTQPT